MTILLLRLLLSFCFDWEDISNTRDSISSTIQTPRILSKILRCLSYFWLSFQCLDILMKHCFLCLAYYTVLEKLTSIFLLILEHFLMKFCFDFFYSGKRKEQPWIYGSKSSLKQKTNLRCTLASVRMFLTTLWTDLWL